LRGGYVYALENYCSGYPQVVDKLIKYGRFEITACDDSPFPFRILPDYNTSSNDSMH
jgi:hypothetical protein